MEIEKLIGVFVHNACNMLLDIGMFFNLIFNILLLHLIKVY